MRRRWPVRAFRRADAAKLARLHREAMAPLGQRGWNEAEIATLAKGAGGFGLVVESGRNASVLGFVLARTIAGEAEILTLAVDPLARRRGIGSALLERAAAEAVGRGAERLLLEVSVDNAGARELYERAGFRGTGRRPGYYRRLDGGAVDALVLARTL